MTVPSDPNLRFTRHHLWVRVRESTALVGVTDAIEEALDEMTHADLPEPDDHHFEEDEEVGVLEAMDNSIGLYAPVSGRVVGVNNGVISHPEVVADDPFGDGWLFEMEPDDMADLDALMGWREYEAWLAEREQGRRDSP